MTISNKQFINITLPLVLGLVFLNHVAIAQEPGPGPDSWDRNVEQRIDHWLDQLAQTQPERARELRKLQDSDPEAFRRELRQEFERARERDMPPGPAEEGRGRGYGRQSGPKGPRDGERARQHFERQLERYMEWLEENYPEEAERLTSLREKSPEEYFGELRQSMKTYGSIMEMERRNPELAEVLREDLQLQSERDELLKELKTADKERKEDISAQLRSIIERRFDIIIKKKELRYKELLERLERLRNAVENQKAQLDQLQEQKQGEIEKRMKELLGESDGLDWD